MTEVSPDNQGFANRVKELVKIAGSKEKLAQAIGISSVMIGKYEAGSEPARDKILALANATGVRIEWLVSGKGPKFQADYEAECGPAAGEGKESKRDFWGGYARGFQERAPHRRSDDDYCYIPLYDVKASAGGGELVERENVLDFLSFKAEWIRTALHASPQDLYLIHVDGESMEPTLRPGDVILVDHRQASVLPRDGIYVMRMDGSLLVKRLQRMPGNLVRVTSDNQAYEPFTVSLSDEGHELSIVGRVVWCGRRM